MQGTYSEIYLDEAMRNMGEMIEYGEDACGLDQDLLLRIFIRSGYADRWEKGDPRVICGLSGTELCRRPDRGIRDEKGGRACSICPV